MEGILEGGTWSPISLADAIGLACSRKRYSIANRLVYHGAQPKQASLQICCPDLDLPRAGTLRPHRHYPERDNDFSPALSSAKACPIREDRARSI